jgi:hypothetical protein
MRNMLLLILLMTLSSLNGFTVNSCFLGSPDDSKIIILSDSNEEKEEVREEKSSGPEDVVASAIVNPASAAFVSAPAEKSSTPAASPADVDEDPRVTPNDSSDGLAPGPKMGKDSGGRDEAAAPRAVCAADLL